MDRCIIHHDNRWTLHGFTKLIETTYDHFTINRSFKSVGISLMPFVHKSSNIYPLAWYAFDRNRVPLFLPGIQDIRNETKTRCITIAQVNNPFSIFFDECRERFPLLLGSLRVRPLLHGLTNPTPADCKRF